MANSAQRRHGGTETPRRLSVFDKPTAYYHRRYQLGEVQMGKAFHENLSRACAERRSGAEQARIGWDLESRLIAFATQCGAVSAHIDRSGPTPALVARGREGRVFRISLREPAGQWHAALDEIDNRFNEHARAGLNRFLRVDCLLPRHADRALCGFRPNRHFHEPDHGNLWFEGATYAQQ